MVNLKGHIKNKEKTKKKPKQNTICYRQLTKQQWVEAVSFNKQKGREGRRRKKPTQYVLIGTQGKFLINAPLEKSQFS